MDRQDKKYFLRTQRSLSRVRKGQSVLEMGILLLAIVVAVVAMQTYLKRGIQGRFRQNIDMIGDQYDPANTTGDSTLSHVSNTTTITNTDTRDVVLTSCTSGYYCTSSTDTVQVTTSTSQTHYDNTLRSGYEYVGNAS